MSDYIEDMTLPEQERKERWRRATLLLGYTPAQVENWFLKQSDSAYAADMRARVEQVKKNRRERRWAAK